MPRIDFLEWLPDLDDFFNKGLVTADNLIHQPEGYKEVKQQTGGAFSTLTSVGNMGTNVTAIQVKPVGTGGTNLAAWFRSNPSTPSVFLEVGDPAVGALGSIESATLSSVGSMKISAFQVCELNDSAFLTAQADGNAAAGTAIALNLTGFLTYSVPIEAEATTSDFNPQQGILNITGYAPTVVVNEERQFPGAGSLAITGYAPTIDPGTPTVVITPTSLFKLCIGSLPCTTASASAAVTGGVPPYTYAWTWQTGGSGITITSPTSQSTTFSVNQLGVHTGTALVTITDADDQQDTDTVSVQVEAEPSG